MTVVCGEISGELERSVSREGDGGLVVAHAARIDGLRDRTGIARIESTSVDELTSLATVASFLADEMARRGCRDLAPAAVQG